MGAWRDIALRREAWGGWAGEAVDWVLGGLWGGRVVLVITRSDNDYCSYCRASSSCSAFSQAAWVDSTWFWILSS